MAKAVFIADVHVKLGQKKVPTDWQYNRFMLLADELNKISCDYVIIGGDLLDVANPSVEEIGLMFDFLQNITADKVLIPGNHEMTTKTRDCFEYLDKMLNTLNTKVIREFEHYDGIDYIPYNILFKKFPQAQSKLAVTHVRGEIPPHVLPEVELDKFSEYDKVFAGDLHSYKNSQLNILYPGSPFTTSFHRTLAKGSNGYFVIDTVTGEHEWVELDLPQLLRVSVDDPADMVETDYHHTIYELSGDLEELAKVENSELLDKKVTNNVSTEATLDLKNTVSISEELVEYLQVVRGMSEDEVPPIIKEYKDVTND